MNAYLERSLSFIRSRYEKVDISMKIPRVFSPIHRGCRVELGWRKKARLRREEREQTGKMNFTTRTNI